MGVKNAVKIIIDNAKPSKPKIQFMLITLNQGL
jgi:hypothetical protein